MLERMHFENTGDGRAVLWAWKKDMLCELDQSGSGLCQTVGFGIRSVETLGYVYELFVSQWFKHWFFKAKMNELVTLSHSQSFSRSVRRYSSYLFDYFPSLSHITPLSLRWQPSIARCYSESRSKQISTNAPINPSLHIQGPLRYLQR
jgi:hypothetical protein